MTHITTANKRKQAKRAERRRELDDVRPRLMAG
jgi:hypothetical protein